MLNYKTLPAGPRHSPTVDRREWTQPRLERASQQPAERAPNPVSSTVVPMSNLTSNPDFESWSEWNPATFEQVVTQYQSRLYRFIYSIVGEAELAHDLTQDTFLSAYRHLLRRSEAAQLDNPSEAEMLAHWQQTQTQNNMSAWLYTIARNAALSEMRRRKVVRFLPFFHKTNNNGVEEELDGLADTAQIEAGGNLEARTVLHDELEQAMNRVGRDKLTALLLHMDGFSYKEICEITGDSLSSVKSQIFRAKESLRRALGTKLSPLTQASGEVQE